MVQTERSKDLLLALLKPCFFEFEDWPVELVESALAKNMDAGETLEQVFRFRTLLLNFLEACPLELIDHIYSGQEITSVCNGVASMQASTLQTFLKCLVQNGLTSLFIKLRFSGAGYSE